MEFTTDIFSQFDKKWALLTAGDKTAPSRAGIAGLAADAARAEREKLVVVQKRQALHLCAAL